MSILRIKELEAQAERKDKYILQLEAVIGAFGDELDSSVSDVAHIKNKIKKQRLEFSGDYHEMKILNLRLDEAEKVNNLIDAIADNIGYERRDT